MSSNTPRIEELRESFALIYHGPDRLQREYDLIQEAERLNMPLDHYRRLYELRTEEHIDPYPKPKQWREIPWEWAKWFIQLPGKKKLSLLRKGGFWLVKQGAALTVIYAVGHYIWTIPLRQKQAEEQKKQAHYQAWQMINSAARQRASAGRIEAIQDLNKDHVSLAGLTVETANLNFIHLEKADLALANLQKSVLYGGSLQGANLNNAYLQQIYLGQANLQGASLQEADLQSSFLQFANFQSSNLQQALIHRANLQGTNFQNANLQGADLKKANFQGTKLQGANLQGSDLREASNLTPEQVKATKNWEKAHYDPKFREQLSLPPETAENQEHQNQV